MSYRRKSKRQYVYKEFKYQDSMERTIYEAATRARDACTKILKVRVKDRK